MFVVAIFTDENEVEVVPMKWMVGQTHCLWPPYKASQIRMAVRSCKDPDTTFSKYPCRVLYQCDSYEKAVRKCKSAETTSDLDSCNEKRKRRPTFRYLESDSESDSPPSKHRREALMHRPAATPVPPPAPVPPPTPVLPAATLPPPTPIPQRNLFPDSPIIPGNHQTFSTPRSKRVEEKMLQLLEEIREQNRTSQRLMTLILRKISSTPTETSDELPNGIKFPLETPQDLKYLEEKLSDPMVKEKVFGHLSSIGGINVPDAIRRIMKHVLGHNLSTEYNWVGKGGKKAAFSILLIKDVIIRAVRKNMPAATSAEIEPVMKDWLRYAKDRQGGRNDRRKSLPESC